MNTDTHAPSRPVIVWFRKDLRLDDNHALHAAIDSGRPIIPVYIREPAEAGTGPLGPAQEWWLHHSLQALAVALERLESRLVLRSGEAQAELMRLVGETGAEMVVWNRRYDPQGIAVDGPLKVALCAEGLTVKSFSGQLLHEPSQLKTSTGGPYRVYSPFWRALESAGEPEVPLEAPVKPLAATDFPACEDLDAWKLLPTRPNWASHFSEVWTPGEAGALQRLRDFIAEGLAGYKVNRDHPGIEGTSRLSPHLASGEISPARIWHETRGLDAITSGDLTTFRKELAWRDFSYHLLFHHPDLPTQNLNRKYDEFVWEGSDALFERWTKGQTGFPIVDAGMRQLWRHGVMHNRVRMIVASFLIKDLLIDWRRGEQWFRETLVDADPASNAASWQWVAGSGADAAPFFRVFNPMLQGEKFDADGTYVKTFVPELKDMPARYVQRPFEAPADVLRAAGVTLGKTYPMPIIDHAVARNRALAAYTKIKDAA